MSSSDEVSIPSSENLVQENFPQATDESFKQYLSDRLTLSELKSRELAYKVILNIGNPYQSTKEFVDKYNTFNMQFNVAMVPATMLFLTVVGSPFIAEWINVVQQPYHHHTAMSISFLPLMTLVNSMGYMVMKKSFIENEHDLRTNNSGMNTSKLIARLIKGMTNSDDDSEDEGSDTEG